MAPDCERSRSDAAGIEERVFIRHVSQRSGTVELEQSEIGLLQGRME
jgi:hypothetical protein